jgi:hypothetical protein
MNKINFENLPSTNTPLNAENLNLMQTNIENAINGGTVLWTGAWFMNANQQAQLSENISDQNNGIVLIWSPYSDGQAQNWGYVHTFISKYQLQAQGNGVNCILMSNDFSFVAGKYIYINDSYISGNNENETSGTRNGITYKNNSFVLRAVIGV